MKVKILSEPIDKMPSDTLVLSVFKDEKPLKGANGLVDWRQCGLLSKLLMNNTFSGEYKEVALILSDKRKRAPKILIVGLGESKEFNEARLEEIVSFTAASLKKIDVKKISLAIPGSSYFPQNYSKSTEIVITSFAESYEKKGNLLEMIIFETGRGLAMVCEGANNAKAILSNNLLLTVDI